MPVLRSGFCLDNRRSEVLSKEGSKASQILPDLPGN